MPAIKKRITAEYMAEREQQRSEENGRPDGDASVEVADDAGALPEPAEPSPVKRKTPRGGGGANQLKWLDGEVLLEKRKRTIPPAELKLATWLDLNFEKKPEVHLSSKTLYSFYTDMCQQEGGGVVEIHQFNKMLREKFGKEFGLKEGSIYNGLLRESKTKKKPTAKAHSLGLKIKDLIEEALKASGNPKKGMRFHGIKQYVAAKYPAFQIEHRPAVLRSALERGVGYGKLELVKGIGFCGFYRLPGPSEVDEEEPKEQEGKEKEDKEGEDEENGEKTDGTATDEEKKEEERKTEDEKSKEEEEEGKEQEKEAEGDEQPAKKRAKRKAKPKRKPGYKSIDHSNPQRIEDVFPLALTYMSEPKEASFSKIKKYLERYYGKSDIEDRLLRTLENGCDTGMWERVSGSGKSGSFQLQVDSFNPDYTESLTDMVCSAIIACSEPKTASYQLIKSYINDYHPDFNIESRPHLLKKAIMRAIQNNLIVQVSGLGMTGSFQLTEPFLPSPAILAGNDEDEEFSDEGEEGGPSSEVYVVRKTKSGRRAPVERLEYRSEKKMGRPSVSSPHGPSRAGRMAGKKPTPKYADSDTDESSESEVEENYAEKYTPRNTKSGRGRVVQSAKSASRGASIKSEESVASLKGRGKPKKSVEANESNSVKKGRPANAKGPAKGQKNVEAGKEGRDASTWSTKPGRMGSNNSSVKETPSKQGRGKKTETATRGRVTNTAKSHAEDDVDDENYYEIEEAAPSPPKKAKQQKAAGKDSAAKTTEKRKAGGEKGASGSVMVNAGRPARSASKSARNYMKESAASDSDEGDEYVARPTASGRGARKR